MYQTKDLSLSVFSRDISEKYIVIAAHTESYLKSHGYKLFLRENVSVSVCRKN